MSKNIIIPCLISLIIGFFIGKSYEKHPIYMSGNISHGDLLNPARITIQFNGVTVVNSKLTENLTFGGEFNGELFVIKCSENMKKYSCLVDHDGLTYTLHFS